MEPRKMVLIFAEQRHRHREQTCGHSWGVEGEGGRYGERTWKHTLPYVKQTANGNLLNDSGNSNQLPNNLEGCDGERGGGMFKQEGTWVNKPKVDSCCCSIETNAIL